MEVRFIEERDNPGLIELSRKTPMEGVISAYTERAPDYFAFYNLHGVNVQTLTREQRDSGKYDMWTAAVAEDEGKIVGVMSAAAKGVNFGGQPIRIGYIMDARVDPEYRRRGLTKQIGIKFVEDAGAEWYDCVIGYILRGNEKAVKGITEGGRGIFMGKKGGTYTMYQLSMYRPYWVPDAPAIERATEKDKAEIIDLLAEFYRPYNFSPIFTEEKFDRMLQVTLGYSYRDFRVVRESGRIVALIGLWDQTPVRQVVVMRNTPVIRLGITIAKFLRLFFKAPRPPVEGQPMRSLYIKHIACRPGCTTVLKKMLKVITNEVRRTGQYHFIWGAFFQADPLLGLFKGLTKTELKSDMFFGPWNTSWTADAEKIGTQPAYADFSLV